MRKIIGNFIFLLGFCYHLQAQQPAAYEDLGVYKEAVELFDKGKYGAAKEKFDHFLIANAHHAREQHGNDLVAEAKFYQAVSAFNLLNGNASDLFAGFIAEYPTHSRVDQSWFYIGKMHYIKRDYELAVEPLRKIEAGNLTKDQVVEARFILGYGYYKKGEMREAMSKFRQIRHSKGRWGEMGAYYFAVIAYQNGDYSEAYEAFSRVDPDAEYAKNLDQLKASCLLKLERYDELDQLGGELVKSKARGSHETFFILGNAAYDREKYNDCIGYFEKFEGKRGRMNREGQYRLAYSYYRTGDYANAMKRFDKALKPEDAVAQNSYYFLGHSFLKVEKYDNARTAFKKASELDYDRGLSGEALFQYAKASFETRYFEESLSALQAFLKEYPESEYVEEANALVGEILLYTNNYKDAIRYLEESSGLRTKRSQMAYQRACYYYALTLYEKRKYDIATEYFQKALNQRHDREVTLSSYYWYAESLFRQQDYSGAISGFQNFLKQPYAAKHESYALAWYGIGWANLKMKKYDAAGKNFEKFIGLTDRERNKEVYVDAMLRAGDCEFATKNFSGALKYFRQVRDFNRMHVDYALYQMGQIYFRMKDYQKTADVNVRLATNYRKSEYRDDALITAAEMFLTWLDDFASCSRYCTLLIREHKDSEFVPGAYTRLAIAQAKAGNRDKAIKHFKTVAYDHCYNAPARTAALRSLSDLLSARDYDAVESRSRKNCPFEITGGINTEDEALAIQIADQRKEFEEDYQSAAERYSNYLGDFPNGRYRYHATFHRGECYAKLGQQDMALQDFESVYQATQPNDYAVKALKGAAEIQKAKGNTLAAMELYTAMEAKSDKMEDRLAAQFGKADIHLAKEDYSAAKAELMAIYSDQNTTDYSRTKANVKIAACEYHLGNADEAFRVFSEIEKDHSNVFGAESQYYITQILHDRGDYEQSRIAAIYLHDEYSSYNYWKAKAYLVLAENYLALGDTFQAKEGTLESLAALETFPDIAEAAAQRIKEIEAMQNGNNRREAPSEDDDDNIDDLIDEEDNQ
ncbi:MAG: tetratricopeptide repeat protein [Bacteroidota bacterium]